MEFEKLSPAALRQLLEGNADGILAIDQAGQIQFANRAAGALLGRPVAELVGGSFGVPLIAGEKTEIEVQRPGAVTVCELRVARSDIDGEPTFLVALRDVTEAALLQQERERARHAAEAASRAKSALLNMVAHEFRTPLTVIHGYATMMVDEDIEPIPDGWREPVQRVLEKVAELNSMVTDVLMAARLEAGRLQGEAELVDLREVVKESVRRAQGRFQLLSATLEVRLPPAPVPARVDRGQVGIIIDNLINNALNYSEDDQPWVMLELECEQRTALLRVTDRGIGIPEDLQGAIFERFIRVENHEGEPHPGTGLGLSIARDLADLNGGELRLERSLPGQGSSFRLQIPLAI